MARLLVPVTAAAGTTASDVGFSLASSSRLGTGPLTVTTSGLRRGRGEASAGLRRSNSQPSRRLPVRAAGNAAKSKEANKPKNPAEEIATGNHDAERLEVNCAVNHRPTVPP